MRIKTYISCVWYAIKWQAIVLAGCSAMHVYASENAETIPEVTTYTGIAYILSIEYLRFAFEYKFIWLTLTLVGAWYKMLMDGGSTTPHQRKVTERIDRLEKDMKRISLMDSTETEQSDQERVAR